MKKINKGKKGYINYKKKLNLCIVLAFAIIIISLFVSGILIFKSRNNYCTLIAVVLVLPAAKFITSYIITCRATPIDKESYSSIDNIGYDYMLYDLIIANSKSPQGIMSAAIDGNSIYLYEDGNIDIAFISKSITDFLSNVKITANVHIYKDKNKYIKAVKETNINFNKNDKELIARTDYTCKQLLNMCI